MEMTRSWKKWLQEYLDRLNRSPDDVFPSDVKAESTQVLPQRLDEFWREPDNRTQCRVKREASRRVKTALKQLGYAVRRAADENEDVNIRKEAKKLVRAAPKCEFAQITKKASGFQGKVQASGHRREERKRRENRQEYQTEAFDIIELTSSDQLAEVGRKLELCVARRGGAGRVYHDDLRAGDLRFFEIRDKERGTTTALMAVDPKKQEVMEISGRGNEDFKPSRKQALGILGELVIEANDVETFASVGAFSVFLDPRVKSGWIPIDHPYELMILCPKRPKKKRQLVVCKARRNREGRRFATSWSMFVPQYGLRRRPRFPKFGGGRRHVQSEEQLVSLDTGSWHEGAMSTEEFNALMVRFPDVHRVIRRFLVDQSRRYG